MDAGKDIRDLFSRVPADQQGLPSKALIIQPGAIGDCILTLPLAKMLKDELDVGTVEILGRSSYMDYFVGRSCVDGIRDMDSVDLHRLFVSSECFDPEDSDPLIEFLAGYKIIITFLGSPGSDFEKNLLFAANCSNSVEVATFALKCPAGNSRHVTSLYAEYLASIFHLDSSGIRQNACHLKPTDSDIRLSRELLSSLGFSCSLPLAVLHPGSGDICKCWHIDNFYSVAQTLSELKINPVFLIGPAELERFRASTIDRIAALAPVISDFNLTEILQLLSCVSCFIGNDSGISHMAGALGVCTIACFGPTDPAVYSPVGPKVKIFKFDSDEFSSAVPDSAASVAACAQAFLTS